MTYLKGRPRGPLPGAISGFDPFASIKGLLTPPTIDMPEDFVGNQNALPICPYTDANGWCRKYVGGPPVKMAVNVAKPAGSTSSTSTPSLIDTIFGALTSTVKLPTPAPAPVRPQGMSSTTKVALAGGAVLLVALVASRR